MPSIHELLYPVYFAFNALAYQAEWVALVIFGGSTLNWIRKGPGEQYTAVWWAAALLVGMLALIRP